MISRKKTLANIILTKEKTVQFQDSETIQAPNVTM